LGSCGYSLGGRIEHTKVKLSLLDNTTERRIHEFDLTSVIAREMASAGIAVNAPNATVGLVGKIQDFREPTLVETTEDAVLVGSVSIQIELSLVSQSDGRVLWTASHEESASYATQRYESRETARAEVFDRLARWVVTKLEKDW
jgi:hypothetical protein